METPFKTLEEYYRFLFVVFLLAIGYLYYGYNTEIKKQKSATQQVCGKITDIYEIHKDAKSGGIHKYFKIESQNKQNYTFSRRGTAFKEYSSPYWDSNQQFFSKMSIGDNVCVTFSPIYHENPKKETLYLLKIQSNIQK